VQHVDKLYNVQIDCLPTPELLAQLIAGTVSEGERLAAKRVDVLRQGEKNAWLEIVLDEGRNRHIRRLLEAQRISVLRLIRIAIGPLALGDLPKGQWRHLEPSEVASLSSG
jgi:23S rRNA pseudouridine2605 synthase